jgi:hypothetical protein
MVDRLLLDGIGYLNLPGASGDKADTPDHADFAIAGDIDIRVLAAATDWTPTGDNVLIAQDAASPNRGWFLTVRSSDGVLVWRWSVAGTAVTTVNATVAPTISNGEPLWVRVTFDVDNGSAQKETKFYTSTDPLSTDPAAVTWTQLGTTVTSAGVTSLFNSNALPTLGADQDLNRWTGTIYYAEVRNGIGGTIVTNPDFRTRVQYTSDTSLTDTSGKVWTVRGAASWSLPPGVTDSYQLEDASGILVLESSVPDVFIPYTNPMPQLLAQ